MAERATVRWHPALAVLELSGTAIGPAGTAVLDHGAVRLAFDVGDPGVLTRIDVDLDEEVDLDRDAFLAALVEAGVPTGGGPEPSAQDVRIDGALATALERLGRLALVDDALRADPLGPVARLVATCEAAALGLAAGPVLATTWNDAAERLWGVVGDPDLDALVAGVDAPTRALLVELLARCRPTGDPLLDDAVTDLHARWSDAPPAPLREPAVPAPAAPAPARLEAAGAPAARRRGAAARAEVEALAGLEPLATPVLARVGDEARVALPASAAPDDWVRVGHRVGRVLLAAVPVARAVDGVARLPVDGGLADHRLIVDVVADPAAPVRDTRGAAMAEALSAGREAAAAERRGRLDVAREAWSRSAERWHAAGDAARALEAEQAAATPQAQEPLAHELLPDHVA